MKVMIIKAILNTDQTVNIYNSLDDVNEEVRVEYRATPEGVSFCLASSRTTTKVVLYPIWRRLRSQIEEPTMDSIKSIVAVNDDDEVVFEVNNITNYTYSVTFGNTVIEAIDFVTAE